MKIPWDSLQEYLQLHHMCIQNFVDLVKNTVMTKESVENILPNSFKKLLELITKILRDNCDANDSN